MGTTRRHFIMFLLICIPLTAFLLHTVHQLLLPNCEITTITNTVRSQQLFSKISSQQTQRILQFGNGDFCAWMSVFTANEQTTGNMLTVATHGTLDHVADLLEH